MYILRGLSFVFVVLTVFSTLTADVIYEQNVKTSLPMMGETEIKSTVYLKDDKEKTESLSKVEAPVPGMAQPMEVMSTVITRLDKGLMWILDETEKTYTEMDLSAMKEMMEETVGVFHGEYKVVWEDPFRLKLNKMTEETEKMIPEEEEAKPVEVPLKVEVTRLEEKEKIEGYECEKVKISMSIEDKEEDKTFDMIANLWIAEEKGSLKEIVSFNQRLEELSAGDGGMMEGLSGMIPGGMKVMAEYQKKLKDLKGFPIVSEITVKAEGEEEPVMNLRTHIQNIRSAKLKDSEFEIPEGFKKLEGSLNPMEGD